MTITLVCYGGLSTSILVSKMEEALNASVKFRDKGIKVQAFGKEEYMDNLEETEIILLGPQVGMILDEVKETVKGMGKDIPVLVIDKDSYGMMDAVPILKSAFQAIKENREKNR